jgi:small subunit ribosomal protein S21
VQTGHLDAPVVVASRQKNSLDDLHQIGNNAFTSKQSKCAVNFTRKRGVYRLAEVRLQDGESLENALRRFKRKVQQEDIIKEIKKHSFYLKPGEKRRVKQALARKRVRKKTRHDQD